MPAFHRQRWWTILRSRSVRAGSLFARRSAAGLLFSCILVTANLPVAQADDERAASGTWQRLASAPSHSVGSLSCASATCHGRPPAIQPAATRAGDEYLTWFEHDPHARASQTLDSVEFQRILTTVSGAPTDSPVTHTVYRQCAACHDPEGLVTLDRGTVDAADTTLSGDAGGRGIGCESCHGQAERWLSKHYERGARPADLMRLGMRNLNDLVLRGRVCAGCHVGDDDHDMNHDMIAAGHPPLRFELSAYHDLIRHKHWLERERIRDADFKLELWSAGQVAVADATLGLTASRAMRATSRAAVEREPRSVSTHEPERAAPWPEFAEYDCFACHQRLRPVTESPVGGGLGRADRTRTVVGWQTWNLARQGPGARWLADPRGATPTGENAGPWSFAIDKLRGEMSDLRHADPARVAAMANDGREALRRKFNRQMVAAISNSAASVAAKSGVTSLAEESETLSGTSAVWSLVGRPNAASESWAEACHEWLLLRSAFLAIADRQQWPARSTAGSQAFVESGVIVDPVVDPGPDSLDPVRRERLERQFRDIAQSLSFGSTQIEWPAYDWSGLPARDQRTAPLSDLPSIVAALESLAAELQSLRTAGHVRENTSSP